MTRASDFAEVGPIDVSGAGPTRVAIDLSACDPGTRDVALKHSLDDAPAS